MINLKFFNILKNKIMSQVLNSSNHSKQVKLKLILGPPSYVLDKIQTACFNEDGSLQTKMTCIALGQFAVVNNASASYMMHHVFSYLRGSKSVAGLESLFLSGLAHLHRMHEYGLYNYGVSLWLKYSRKLPHRKPSTHFIYLDREFNMVTFLPGNSIQLLTERLEETLSEKVIAIDEINKKNLTGSIGDVIRDPRGFADSPWDHGFSKCVGELTSIGTIGGAIVGGVAGAEGGPAGVAGGAKIGGIVGGFVTTTIGVWTCDDPKPAKEGKPENPTFVPDMGADQPPPETKPPTSEPTTSPKDLQSTPPEDKQSTPDNPFAEIQCNGYPNPDAPDNSNGNPRGNPLSYFAEPLFYPNPETGLPGGPAGMPLNFLMHNLPRLGYGNQPVHQLGFLA